MGCLDLQVGDLGAVIRGEGGGALSCRGEAANGAAGAQRRAARLFEDEGFEALHAGGKLVEVIAEDADVLVEHDVEVAAEPSQLALEFRAQLVAHYLHFNAHGPEFGPDFRKAVRDHAGEVVDLRLDVGVFHVGAV